MDGGEKNKLEEMYEVKFEIPFYLLYMFFFGKVDTTYIHILHYIKWLRVWFKLIKFSQGLTYSLAVYISTLR